MKQKIGAIVLDLPRFIWAVRPGWLCGGKDRPWVMMRNRNERLIPNPSGEGVQCGWQWTSDLHIAKVFPWLGGLLLRRALRDYPIALKDAPEKMTGEPEVSFVIGHRGIERLPHLLLTLRSIAAQVDVSVECIVVEQSIREEVRASLPGWVRYVHTPLTRPDLPYCRSWALNAGARQAKGRLLVLHDGDLLVPRAYARELSREFARGSEVVQLKRFVFYLTREGTERLFAANERLPENVPEKVVQNLEAGGSVAAGREAYAALGGFDESFVGWGGEDNEFWDRAQTRSVCAYARLPLVHLWHPDQPEKRIKRLASAERQTR